MDERIIIYGQDGTVALIEGERRQEIEPGWSPDEIDRAAAAFFDQQEARG